MKTWIAETVHDLTLGPEVDCVGVEFHWGEKLLHFNVHAGYLAIGPFPDGSVQHDGKPLKLERRALPDPEGINE